MANIAIIGGGLVGLCTALALKKHNPRHSVVVLGNEPDVAMHQSSRNSGVPHCGLDYQTGTLKAQLAVNGIRQMIAFRQQHGIAHEMCGKIVACVDDAEVARLRDLHPRFRLASKNAGNAKGIGLICPDFCAFSAILRPFLTLV